MRRRIKRLHPVDFMTDLLQRATEAQKTKLQEMMKFGWKPFQTGEGQRGFTIWCACDAAKTATKVNPRANHSYITPDGVMTRYEPKKRR